MHTIAIIPAFNEEGSIAKVIGALQEVPLVSEVIVVSDGSTDRTAQVASQSGAKVVKLEENRGKGGAMKAGIDITHAGIILFLDADLIGLTPRHVYKLLDPVVRGEADMTVGVFKKGRIATDLAQIVAPYLSGQRAVRRSLLEDISGIDMARFGVEVALTRHIEAAGTRVQEVTLEDMSHLIKEEKMGVFKGFASRIKMYWEIVKCLTSKETVK